MPLLARRRAQPFQGHAALADGDRFLHGHDTHPRAPVADPFDQPLGTLRSG